MILDTEVVFVDKKGNLCLRIQPSQTDRGSSLASVVWAGLVGVAEFSKLMDRQGK